ncbi:DUF2213 domain-containing protein [Panacagrimonas sp.]|uniref:DUF2213 domain-containing protein n=1 Tax=Panacagrimonas sp. TaxID=2480088 RepID=UPI003B5247D7
MMLYDAVTTTGVRRTADGYLVADVRVARTGIQEYAGAELGVDKPIVRVYRPEESVFAADAMRSYAYRPMTNDHPRELVTADNWKKYSTGQTGGDVVRDGEFVRVPLVMMDAAAVKDFESGKRELSMGYTAEIVFGDGVTPQGEAYDAIQTNLKMNHLALVDAARGGNALRIGDWRASNAQDHGADKPPPMEKSEMSDTKTRTILVDGLSVETTDAGAQAIAKLQGQIKDAQSASDALVTDHAKAIAAKDADLAKKDAEIDSLKGKVLSDAELDKRVKVRADLIATAKAIADADYTGKSDADIRKAVVVAKFGDGMADKPEAYIAARFDILAEDAKADPVRKVLMKGADGKKPDDNGYSAYVADISNSWKPNQKEAH